MAFYIYIFFFFTLATYFPFCASRERVVLVKLDENKNHPFFSTQVGRPFLSESVISILHSITLQLIALFSLVETDFSVAKRFQKALPYMQYALCARTSLLRFHLFASIKARHRFRWIGSSIEFSSLKKTLESSLAVVRNKSILPLSLSLSKDTSIRFFFEVKFLKVTLVQVFFPSPRSFFESTSFFCARRGCAPFESRRPLPDSTPTIFCSV